MTQYLSLLFYHTNQRLTQSKLSFPMHNIKRVLVVPPEYPPSMLFFGMKRMPITFKQA